MREEKRLYHRFPVSRLLRGKALSPLEGGAPSRLASQSIRGVITDIGLGGIGLVSEQSIDIADPFVCEILIPDLPVGVPTLLQVRWALTDGQGHTYRAGLQFLL